MKVIFMKKIEANKENNIGKNLAILRKKFRYSRKDIAELLGVNEMTVGVYERGEKNPSIPKLIKLADYFAVSLDDLIRGNAENPEGEIFKFSGSLKHGGVVVGHIPHDLVGFMKAYLPHLNEITQGYINTARKLGSDKTIRVVYEVVNNSDSDSVSAN